MPIITVKQTGGDWPTLDEAFDAAGVGDTIEISGAWTISDVRSAIVAVDCQVKTLGVSRHPGYWDEAQNHYRLVTSALQSLLLNGAYSLVLEGVAIEQAGSGNSDECFRCIPGVADTVVITDCLFNCFTSTFQQDCIYTGYRTSIGTITVERSIFWGAGRGGIHIQNDENNGGNSATIEVVSSTFYKCGSVGGGSDGFGGGGIVYGRVLGVVGFNGTPTINCHNVVSVENNDGGNSADYNWNDQSNLYGPASFNVSYSIDSDASIAAYTSDNAGNLASRTGTDTQSPGAGSWVIFEDATTGPYNLLLFDNETDNDAQQMHSVQTANGLTINNTADIVGKTRPQGALYDCGPFEVPVSTGGKTILDFQRGEFRGFSAGAARGMN